MIPTATETMPASLQVIYDAANQFHQEESTLDTLRPFWKAHVSKAEQLEGIHIEAEGEVLYLGDLSPGCRACKEGTWDCIFVTMECNLDCSFCYSPDAIPRDYAGSTFGATPAQIAENEAKTHITGISFSGGEPFLNTQRLFEWLGGFKNRYPHKYYWLYTNGILANEKHLQKLGGLGLDEIRFNLAATGYDHSAVMENVAAAARFIPNITVEIPAIPQDAAKLLSCLEKWCQAGVKFLNLHELMYEPGTNSASMAGSRQPIITPDGHRSAINPHSRHLTLAVMEYVHDKELPLSVNDCSLQSKLRQLRGRRRSLSPLVKAPYERLVDNEAYESYCAYRGEDIHFFHPDTLSEMRRQYSDYRFARLVRTAPLSIQDRGRWVTFEKIVV